MWFTSHSKKLIVSRCYICYTIFIILHVILFKCDICGFHNTCFPYIDKLLCVDKDNDHKDFDNDHKDSEGYESGTTAVVCLVRNGEIIVANAGDSRCVLSSKGILDLS